MAADIFNVLNLLPLPIWLAMLLFPRTRFTQRLVVAYWPFIILGGIYLLLLIITLALETWPPTSLSFSTLRAALAGDWGFLAGWAHFLTLDLFAGVWIFRDAKYWGINPGLFLLLTLFFGPLGLGLYLLVRQRKDSSDPVRLLN